MSEVGRGNESWLSPYVGVGENMSAIAGVRVAVSVSMSTGVIEVSV